MRGRSLWARLMTGAVVAAPLAAVAVATPALATTESETYFSYVSAPGDYIGQGRTGTLTAPTAFTISGTAGSVTVSADTGSEWWDVTLAAPVGQQLTTGSYENVTRAPFNSTYGGLAVSSTGRGCNEVKGRFTIYAISADTSGRITSLDATVTQFCDSSTGGLSATVKYAAPYVVPVVLTSSTPSAVADQPVTLTARSAPGMAGGVVFYDGTTAIGQASFDSAGLGRMTTSDLTPGTHALYARIGTATSARLTQVISAAQTSLWFGSEAGDYIGQGAMASYVPPGATLTARGDAGYATVSVDSPGTGQWWTIDVAAPPGELLHVGTYSGAVRAPFRGPGQPGLSVSGTGRGCNTLTGQFTVNSIAANPDGSLASLDATFRQHCEGAAAGLTGRVRFNVPPADSRPASTTTLTGGTTSDGGVPLTAVVSGGPVTPTGQVVFREGATTLGTAVLDGSGRAFLLVSGLTRGSHTLTAEYSGSQAHQPSTGSTTVVVPGIATTTAVTVAKTAKAGKPLSVAASVSAAVGAQPTGLVRLYDGIEPVGTAASLVNGKATIVWTPVAKGSRGLTVRYLGSPTHAESVSAAAVVRVN